jgi:hypothetical protein
MEVELEDQDARDRLRLELIEVVAEVEQLKETISALRGELEAREYAHELALQELRQAAADEGRQLQATIEVLRGELEAASAARAADASEAERLHGDELRELQATILTLRGRLEGSDGD